MKNIILIIICIISSSFSVSQETLTTVPKVQHWKASGEITKFNNVTISYGKNIDTKHTLFIERFKNELKETGITIAQKPSTSSLDLFIDANYRPIAGKNHAYKIQLSKQSTISASSYDALVYATRTVLQIFSQKKYQHAIPNGNIIDYPSYEKRMLLIDVARKFFTVDELKDFIRAMAWVKMNELHLHLSDNSWGGYSAYRLESKKYPELRAKDGHYSWREIRDLQDFAHSYAISIVPEIDSPGHALAFTNIRPDLKSAWLTPNYLDITNKNTYPFMEGILDEVIPHFDAAEFHLGTDEYRINSITDDALKTQIGEAFRKYINHFNKVVRKHGKTTRIWSGFEHMPGITEIDNNITIDMWETSDAKDKSNKGYKIINSSHYYTYIVPGAPYYGVDDKFTYEQWTPEIFSDVAAQNLDKNSAGLLGSKMHIWNDFGPSGYTIGEIARLSIPSMMVFSEKMWGTKAYTSIGHFAKLRNNLLNIPQTKFLARNFAQEKILYASDKKISLPNKQHINISSEKHNAEYPWTLEMTVKRNDQPSANEVLLSSRLATLYAYLSHTFISKKGKEDETKIQKSGFAIVRANQTEGLTPLSSHRPDVIVFDYILPLNKSVKIKIIAEKNKTSLYANGKLVGTENLQMLCPLESIGSKEENTFSGTIEKIEIRELKQTNNI